MNLFRRALRHRPVAQQAFDAGSRRSALAQAKDRVELERFRHIHLR